jgi:lipopolysaccharide transport system permease protein
VPQSNLRAAGLRAAPRKVMQQMRTNLSRELHLLWAMVARELEARFKGTVIGRLWPILGQLAQLLIYVYVFSFVLKVRLAVPGQPEGRLTFGLWLFAGLAPWMAFSNGLSQASGSVLRYPNLVKKVAFPLWQLPLVPVLVAFVEMLLGLGVLVILMLVTGSGLHWHVVLLPLAWGAALPWTIGAAYFAALLTVYIRDVQHLIGIALNLGFFLTPIVYPTSQIPAGLREWVLLLNPLATIVEAHRDFLIVGSLGHWQELVVTALQGVLVCVCGAAAFRRVQSGFADVL